MPRAVVIKYGDPHIAGAIENGIQAALPAAKPLDADEAEVVSAEIDRQKIVRSLVRVANGNTNTPDDYAAMIAREQYKRQKYEQPVGVVRRLGRGIVGAWCLLWAGIFAAHEHLSKWNREE